MLQEENIERFKSQAEISQGNYHQMNSRAAAEQSTSQVTSSGQSVSETTSSEQSVSGTTSSEQSVGETTREIRSSDEVASAEHFRKCDEALDVSDASGSEPRQAKSAVIPSCRVNSDQAVGLDDIKDLVETSVLRLQDDTRTAETVDEDSLEAILALSDVNKPVMKTNAAPSSAAITPAAG